MHSYGFTDNVATNLFLFIGFELIFMTTMYYFSKRKELANIIENFQPDIICNDILNSTISYMKFLKQFGCLVVNFEDLGDGRKLADLVFNPIYYAKKHPKN